MSGVKTINVRDVYMVETLTESDRPVLVFKSRKLCVRVHVYDHTLGTIGQKSHEHLNSRQRAIDYARKKLRGEA